MKDRSLLKKIYTLDPHTLLGEKEIAGGAQTKSGDYVCVCPFCDKVVLIRKDNIAPAEGSRPSAKKLNRPIACGCRQNIDTIRFDFIGRFKEGRNTRMWARLLSLAAACLIPVVVFSVAMDMDDISKTFILCAMLPCFAGLAGLAFCAIMLIDIIICDDHARFLVGGMDKDYEEMVRYHRYMTSGGAGIDGMAGHSASAADSYVPDDFEPDLDAYDRQALYDEQMVDDWIIAGGGNPYDYGDRADAFSDPFGFGGDD